jgi:hypothetical protein
LNPVQQATNNGMFQWLIWVVKLVHWTSQLGLFEGFIIWSQSFDCCRLKHPKIDGSYLTHSWCQLKENCSKAGTSTRGWCMKCCRILFLGNDGEASTEETFTSKKHFPCRFDPCGAKVEFQWCSKSCPLLFYMAINWWTGYHIKATPQWLAHQDTRCQSLRSFGSKLEPCYKCYKFLQRIHLFLCTKQVKHPACLSTAYLSTAYLSRISIDLKIEVMRNGRPRSNRCPELDLESPDAWWW